MKYIPKLSSETKNTLLGGVAGALTVYMESAANGLVAGYPQILKDRLVTMAPRNGELLATVAPIGVTWAVAKKKHSPKIQNVKTGVMLYDLPKLLDLFAYRIAYNLGLPAVGAAPLRLNIRPAMNNGVVKTGYRQVSAGMGKYAQSNNAKVAGSYSGLGRYR